MQDRKKVLASISLLVFGWFIFLHWIGFWLKLDDPEFDLALERAEKTWIKEVELIKTYPFTPVTRAEAARWYVLFAQDIGLVPSWNSATWSSVTCSFADLGDLWKRYSVFK